mgnify:CR=1 FL=1
MSISTNALDISFVQDNHSRSIYGVIRGLHFQKKPFEQSKLVWVPRGEVLDIVVDLRQQSETYLKSETFLLSDKNFKMLFIPKGFAHGYVTLTHNVVFNYALDEIYNPEFDFGVNFFDHDINLKLNLNLEEYELSKKDKTLPFLKDITFYMLMLNHLLLEPLK